MTFMHSLTKVVFVLSAVLGLCSWAWAASCCGGGSASSLVLPKFSRAIVEISSNYEHYNGYWNGAGRWIEDPDGSDLNQYRVNLGYAHRFASNWQAALSIPYIWNKNKYTNLQRNTHGVGDSVLSVWYEAFDKIACVWEVNNWDDLKPAIYWGASLTAPTGTSPYDNVQDNFDITGRGLYRLDVSMLMDKTVYPWNASFLLSYGKHLARPVNREFGVYIEPYNKNLGDRFNTSLSFGYTYFTDEMDSLTVTLAYAYVSEAKATIDSETDTTSGIKKHSLSTTLAWATEDRNWVSTLTWSYAPANDGWGKNFPVTNIITVGVKHVLR